MNRGQEATGGAIEGESSVLPGCALTQSRESLHEAPDRSGIRLVLLGQCIRLSGLLLRQIQSRRDRIEHRVARRTELLGDGPQDQGMIGGGLLLRALGRRDGKQLHVGQRGGVARTATAEDESRLDHLRRRVNQNKC